MEISHTFSSSHRTREAKLGKATFRVFKAIISKWPANPLEVAKEFGEEINGNAKSLSSRYLYHFRKLQKLNMIDMKKLGNTYVAWPTDIEKLRFLHEMIRED